MTKQPHLPRETIPAGPGAWPLAERTLTRYPNQVNERRNPRTSSTATQLLHRYLDQWDGERTTLTPIAATSGSMWSPSSGT
ncbi:MAG: integrase [Solirubrobacterales bacterium]|nr:integrase [Solirubrobacterales bacterium]